ncbi:hypothetical protein AHMF7605_25670 [Adhaeribacter arboris]|uniref:PPM-type phosphatase domain-containing protein n=1 Tax=Adhaeribacter arboris TaxID=2072846 RepID=A0A2T2YMA2_9BACT|nr:protein phosphatase 2C domain-containing protein [Adhaeribacter arboris]PSR56640.1 hypothetical protein AHMF7605_25670 [Adhaeribacter arboris]
MESRVMKLLELVNAHGDGKVMEDAGGYTKNFVWVLDGATGLQKHQYFSATSDAFWVVNNLNQFIALNSTKFESIIDLLKAASNSLKSKAYKDKIPLNILDYERPSYALAFAKVEKEKLKYVVLGDCYVIIKTKNKIRVITDENFLSNSIEKRIFTTSSQINQLDLLKTRRSTMNKVGGYLIGTIEGEAYEQVSEEEIPIFENAEILLCTDGFARAVNMYNLYSWKGIFNTPLNRVVEDIRNLEDMDNHTTKFKKSDDIFAIKVFV